jgi:hypothetical protein
VLTIKTWAGFQLLQQLLLPLPVTAMQQYCSRPSLFKKAAASLVPLSFSKVPFCTRGGLERKPGAVRVPLSLLISWRELSLAPTARHSSSELQHIIIIHIIVVTLPIKP